MLILPKIPEIVFEHIGLHRDDDGLGALLRRFGETAAEPCDVGLIAVEKLARSTSIARFQTVVGADDMHRHDMHAGAREPGILDERLVLGCDVPLPLECHAHRSEAFGSGKKHGPKFAQSLDGIETTGFLAMTIRPIIIAGCKNERLLEGFHDVELFLEHGVRAGRGARLEVPNMQREGGLSLVHNIDERTQARHCLLRIPVGHIAECDERERFRGRRRQREPRGERDGGQLRDEAQRISLDVHLLAGLGDFSASAMALSKSSRSSHPLGHSLTNLTRLAFAFSIWPN